MVFVMNRRKGYHSFQKIVPIIFALILPFFAHPQSPLPFSFEHPGADVGLGQGHITVFLQDRSGFIWIGTDNGLIRYDGYDIVVFSHDTGVRNILSHNHITALAEDREGLIWIGTRRGLNHFDPDTETVTRYLHEETDAGSISSNEITSLWIDSRQRLWVGTVSGLNRADLPGSIFKRFIHDPRIPWSLSSNSIQGVTGDRSGTIWIATRQGVDRIAGADDQADHLGFVDEDGRPIAPGSVKELIVDRRGRLWVAAEPAGLGTADAHSGQIRFMKNPFADAADTRQRMINRLAEDSLGRIWIGFHGFGLAVRDKETGRNSYFRNAPFDPHSLSYDIVTALYCDRNGSMWVGTYGVGINLWNPTSQKFRLLRHHPTSRESLGIKSIRAIFEDRSGRLWVGGYSGLDRIDLQKMTFTHLHKKLGVEGLVRVVIEDRENPERYYWFGFEGGGIEIARFDLKTERLDHQIDFRNQFHLESIDVYSLCDDGRGVIWCGTSKGLIRLNKKDLSASRVIPLTSDPARPQPGILSIIEDRKGMLWMATAGLGLQCMNPKTFSCRSFRHSPDDPGSLGDDALFSLAFDRFDRLWIGTTTAGLNRMNEDGSTFTRFSRQEGLPSNTIYGILFDEKGILWLSTRFGISRFDPLTGHFRNYGSGDGLQSDEFNANSYHRGGSGRLYFGGINGLNFFYPDEIRDNSHIPPVVITDFQLFNRSLLPGQQVGHRPLLQKTINRTETISLTYRENVLGFSFSTLNYINSEKNRYAYKMDGFDREWHQAQTRRFAFYPNLPPGRYRFRVRGANNDGVWNLEGASLRILIAPPFWMTWWFRILSLLLAAGVVIGVHRARTRMIERRNRELEAINEELHRSMEERRRTGEALLASEEKYRTLTENINAGIYRNIPEGQGKFVEMNPMMWKILGYDSKEDLMEVSVLKLYASRQDRERIICKINQEGSVQNEEVQLVKRDGSLIWCAITAVVVRDENGEILYHDGLIEDISNRKRLESQILQIQKMEAVGQLAGGVAHDFNNILTVIIGHAELLLHDRVPDGPLGNSLLEILKSGKRARDLISQLLAFSRRQIVEPKIIDVNRLLTGMNQIFHRLIGEDILIRVELAENLPRIKADPSQMETIFLNLVLNSRDAITEAIQAGGRDRRITIESNLAFLDEAYVASHSGCQVGEYVMMAVSDTGIGMTEEMREKIFEPFFTTKTKERGTGLGLSSVFGIVKQNNGHIYVYSEPGKGTTMKIYWPVSDDQHPSKIHHVDQVVPVSKARETILIVEDDESVREFVEAALISFGYQVTVRPNGQEALTWLLDHRHVDLIITDVVMPKMGGKELAEKAKEIDPEVNILFTSGYTDNHIIHDWELEEGIQFIQKPYTLQALAWKVHEVLHPSLRG